jgi:hypothetical protein
MERHKYISGAKPKPMRRRPIGKGDRVKIKKEDLRIAKKYFDLSGAWEVKRVIRMGGNRVLELERGDKMFFCNPYIVERV